MTMRQARFKTNEMTLSVLSLETGIDISRLSRIENDLLKPTEKQIKKIAKTLKPHKIEYGLCK